MARDLKAPGARGHQHQLRLFGDDDTGSLDDDDETVDNFVPEIAHRALSPPPKTALALASAPTLCVPRCLANVPIADLLWRAFNQLPVQRRCVAHAAERPCPASQIGNRLRPSQDERAEHGRYNACG